MMDLRLFHHPLGISRRPMKNGVIEVKPEINLQGSSNESNINSMHRAMAPVFLVGQWFALCPLQGIRSHHAEDLRFTWRSLKIVYLLVSSVLIFVSLCFSILRSASTGFNFQSSSDVVFHLVSLGCCILFLRLATKWPQFALNWQRLERNQILYGYPNNLRYKSTAITFIILIFALIEHLLAQNNSWSRASLCVDSTVEKIHAFIIQTCSHVVRIVGYSVPIAVFGLFINLYTAFYWTFIDLFLIIISMVLASRFRVLNQYLKRNIGKEMSEVFWKKAREDYNDLSLLTKILDSHISALVLLSFSSNLFYICQQLYNSMTNTVTIVEMVYFYVSFSFLLVRASAVNLYASSISDESIATKNVIYAVPANSYQVEVHRFLAQISTDSIALTGLNFFTVTRTLLLTLAGTIVTYEVVLVQFHTSTGSSVKNITQECFELKQLL